jgi:drug/metabolite transporter (DMT)-like permease
MWVRLIVVASITNGLSAFGLRVLAGWGLAGKHDFHYLVALYVGGAIIASLVYFLYGTRLKRHDILITAGMAVCSILGQLGMMFALARGISGFIVFPVCIAGGMLLVLSAAVVFFRERLSLAGYLGVGIGMAALILLALPQ